MTNSSPERKKEDVLQPPPPLGPQIFSVNPSGINKPPCEHFLALVFAQYGSGKPDCFETSLSLSFDGCWTWFTGTHFVFPMGHVLPIPLTCRGKEEPRSHILHLFLPNLF